MCRNTFQGRGCFHPAVVLSPPPYLNVTVGGIPDISALNGWNPVQPPSTGQRKVFREDGGFVYLAQAC
jgi:hypothetical protein